MVRTEVRPAPGTPDHARFAGAFVNVYTTATSDAEALIVARGEIAEAGWIVLAPEEVGSFDRAGAEASRDELPYYEQALTDGVVLVFHTYPHGEEELDAGT